MKEIAKIIFYFIAVVVLGALLAPPLWWGGHLLFQLLGQPHWAEVLQKSGFHRYFDRAILVAAIALLWPLVKWLRVHSVRELGLQRNPHRWRQFFFGFVIAFVSMAIFAAVLFATDVYHVKSHIDWNALTTIFVGAFVVSIIEEWLFRGALLGLINRSAFPMVGLVFVSALFAIVHFLKPLDGLVVKGDVNWLSGFIEVGGAFWQFGDPMLLLGGFVTLFVVGMILGYARLKTRSLWLPIGLHAGWVISKMSFTKITSHAHAHWPWFGSDILVGLAPLLVLLVTGLFVWWWLSYVNPRSREIHL